jgi:hypothetical protein
MGAYVCLVGEKVAKHVFFVCVCILATFTVAWCDHPRHVPSMDDASLTVTGNVPRCWKPERALISSSGKGTLGHFSPLRMNQQTHHNRTKQAARPATQRSHRPPAPAGCAMLKSHTRMRILTENFSEICSLHAYMTDRFCYALVFCMQYVRMCRWYIPSHQTLWTWWENLMKRSIARRHLLQRSSSQASGKAIIDSCIHIPATKNGFMCGACSIWQTGKYLWLLDACRRRVFLALENDTRGKFRCGGHWPAVWGRAEDKWIAIIGTPSQQTIHPQPPHIRCTGRCRSYPSQLSSTHYLHALSCWRVCSLLKHVKDSCRPLEPEAAKIR